MRLLISYNRQKIDTAIIKPLCGNFSRNFAVFTSDVDWYKGLEFPSGLKPDVVLILLDSENRLCSKTLRDLEEAQYAKIPVVLRTMSNYYFPGEKIRPWDSFTSKGDVVFAGGAKHRNLMEALETEKDCINLKEPGVKVGIGWKAPEKEIDPWYNERMSMEDQMMKIELENHQRLHRQMWSTMNTTVMSQIPELNILGTEEKNDFELKEEDYYLLT